MYGQEGYVEFMYAGESDLNLSWLSSYLIREQVVARETYQYYFRKNLHLYW